MDNLLLGSISIADLAQIVADKVFQRISENQPIPQCSSVPETRLIGDKAAAKQIGCTVQTIGRLRKDKEIPFHKYGRKYFYLASEIDAALKVDARRFGELRGNRKKK